MEQVKKKESQRRALCSQISQVTLSILNSFPYENSTSIVIWFSHICKENVFCGKKDNPRCSNDTFHRVSSLGTKIIS